MCPGCGGAAGRPVREMPHGVAPEHACPFRAPAVAVRTVGPDASQDPPNSSDASFWLSACRVNCPSGRIHRGMRAGKAMDRSAPGPDPARLPHAHRSPLVFRPIRLDPAIASSFPPTRRNSARTNLPSDRHLAYHRARAEGGVGGRAPEPTLPPGGRGDVADRSAKEAGRMISESMPGRQKGGRAASASAHIGAAVHMDHLAGHEG